MKYDLARRSPFSHRLTQRTRHLAPAVLSLALAAVVSLGAARELRAQSTPAFGLDLNQGQILGLGGPSIAGYDFTVELRLCVTELGFYTPLAVATTTATAGRFTSGAIGGLAFPDPDATIHVGPTFRVAGDCLQETVNDAGAELADVLFVNGGGGSADVRQVAGDAGDGIWATLLTPRGGSNGKFVLHANLGAPTSSTVTALPASIGDSCFPMLIPGGATPSAIWSNIGKVDQVGASEYFGGSIADPDRTPVVFLELPAGDLANLPPGTTLTLQGAVVDAASSSPKSVSTTNAVVLRVD